MFEHLSREAPRRRAARGRARAGARRPAVRLQPRAASNSRAGRRPQADQPAGAVARAPRPGRPGPRAPAQVGSPQPAGGHPRSRAHGRRGRLPHRAHPLLHAARRRLRREHPHARRRALDGETRGAARGGRRRARSTATTRRARRAPPPRRASAGGASRYAGLRLVTWVMKLDLLLFGRVRSGPYFALLRRDGGGSGRDEDRLRRPRPARARHHRRLRPRDGRRRGPRRAGTRGRRADDAGAGAVSRGAGPLARRWRRRSGCATCASCGPRRSAHSRNGPAPDVIIERYHNFGGEGMRAAKALGALAVLEVNAPVVDYPGSPKARLDKALLVEPMRRWRDRQCRMADLLVTPAGGGAARLRPARPHRRDRVGRRHGSVRARRRRAGALRTAARGAGGGVRRGVSRLARRRHARARDARPPRRAAAADLDAVLIGDGPELARAKAEAEGIDGVTFTGAVASRPDAGVRWRRRTSASRRSTSRPTRRCNWPSTGRR
ncbi:MAG: hypothetical protein MZV64_13850 [Ignavibacteriales bacterium]|nr:hypothetical protein [Ignavibacteriales bacterium]